MFVAKQGRAEVTRSQILDAAAQIFLEFGYSAANVNDIVSKADVTKGALYFHFESKSALAVALITERDRLVEDATRPIGSARMPAFEKLLHFSVMIAALATTDPIFQAGDQLILEVGEYRASAGKAWAWSASEIAALISTAIEDGDVIPVDPLLAANIILLQFVGARAMLRNDGHDYDMITYYENLWKMFIRTFVNGPVQRYFEQLLNRIVTTHRSQDRVIVSQ